MVSLKMNENSFGPSPRAIEAGTEQIKKAWQYPMNTGMLYQALADFYSLAPENFAVCNGLTSLIDALGTAFLESGEKVIFCAPTFMEYARTASLRGGVCEILPLDEQLAPDLDAIQKKTDQKTGILLICNPNNPTGSFVKKKRIKQLLLEVPQNVIVVVDEAYMEFADDPECESMMDEVTSCPNLVILRTFSKMYGLAGMRLGYAAAKEETIRRIRTAVAFFPVSGAAVAMAVAALQDREYYAEVKKKILEGKKKVKEGLEKAGCRVYPSQNNFLYFETGKDDQAVAARMRELGVDISDRFGHLRVTIGTPEENQAFLDAVTQAMSELRQGRF